MNDLAISVGVILFPGILATIICDQVAAHSPKWHFFKYGVYSFVFGVLCYASLQFVSWAAQSFLNFLTIRSIPIGLLKVWSIATAQKVDIDLHEVLLASLMAPVVAVLATVINDRKWLNRIAQRIGASTKYGDENLFSYYLNRSDIDWVYIRDPKVNQTYEGRVVQWSETDHIQEIVISDVTVYKYDDSKRLYTLPSLYLARTTGTFLIEAIPLQQFTASKGSCDGQKAD